MRPQLLSMAFLLIASPAYAQAVESPSAWGVAAGLVVLLGIAVLLYALIKLALRPQIWRYAAIATLAGLIKVRRAWTEIARQAKERADQ